VIDGCSLKIESFDAKVEKSDFNKVKTLSDLKENIKNSRIPDYEKEFLMEKVDAIAEKLRLIKLVNYKSAIFKANKPKINIF